MTAKTRMQIERIKHLSPLPTDDYYSETEEVLAEEHDGVLDACYSLEALVPHVFPSSSRHDEVKVLYHDDLSASNIIVNPLSFRVTGIVDWECISIHLAWEAAECPFFLRGIEVEEPPPPRTPGGVEPELSEIRKDWEKFLLRHLYQKTLQDDVELSTDIMHKQKFSDRLEDIETNWTASRSWARKNACSWVTDRSKYIAIIVSGTKPSFSDFGMAMLPEFTSARSSRSTWFQTPGYLIYR